MDTSETYIKMCDCPEVQEKQPYGEDAVNSFFHRKEMIYIESKTIWLPRQDQIQEMMNWKNEYTFWKWDTDTFDGEVAGSYYGQILDDEDLVLGVSRLSMEQVWLVFYMYEEHQKTWDGDKWVST